ncbi:hydrolase [Salinisphaera dokdonensis CL-ES53]|uniref:Hydrolase n=1 Tax=Salinisphaera dokdonensis CL-ES53 TaxID=1304272 RepID=A0ABV2AWT8_9GAMM
MAGFDSNRGRGGRHVCAAVWLAAGWVLLWAISADAIEHVRFVDTDAGRVQLTCSGPAADPGEPTVILDSGLGDSALVWSRLQPMIAESLPVCSYDRPGYGESDAALPPRTSAVIVHELHDLLERAGIAPPYLLVGHSFGGWNMQLFAARFSQDTAGLVLVDSSQVNQIARYETELGVRIAPTGVFHISINSHVPPNLAPAEAAQARALSHDPVTWRTAHHELAGFRESEHQVAIAPPLPDIPIVVVSRGARIGTSADYPPASERLWRRLQQEYVDAHPGTVHFIARDSGHYIQLEQPALVARAVCLVAERAGTFTPGCSLRLDPMSAGR